MIDLLRKYMLFFKTHVKLIIFNCVLVAIIFGSRIFNTNITIDTDIMIVYPETTYNWLNIGRWGLILLQKVFGMRWFNPYIECAIKTVSSGNSATATALRPFVATLNPKEFQDSPPFRERKTSSFVPVTIILLFVGQKAKSFKSSDWVKKYFSLFL